jgi:hypothetical protein
MLQRVVWACLFLLGMGCSKGGAGKPAQQPDGSYRIECHAPLSDCLQRVEQVCRDEGYVVSEARDVRELLGHEQGQSQVPVRRSHATVFCGGGSAPPPRAMVEVKGDPVTPRKRERPSEDESPYPEPATLCVPGATQACVGPGGCSGGQACAADGSRYEPCDCGAPKADAAQP